MQQILGKKIPMSEFNAVSLKASKKAKRQAKTNQSSIPLVTEGFCFSHIQI